MKHIPANYTSLFNSKMLYNNGVLSHDLDSRVWEVLGNVVRFQVWRLRYTIYRHVS